MDDCFKDLRSLVGESIRRGEYDHALTLARKALEAFTLAHEPSGEADALYFIGLTHRQQGKYDLAGQALERCLALRERLGESQGAVDARIILGSVLAYRAAYAEALDCLRIARVLSEQQGYSVGEAHALNCMAIIHTELGDNEGALEALHQCLPLYEAAGELPNAARALINISFAYLSLDMPADGLRFAQRALLVFHEVGDPISISLAYQSIGMAQLRLGKVTAALEELDRAREIVEPLGNRYVYASILNSRGKALVAAGRLNEACSAFEQALRHNDASGQRLLYCEVLGQLGRLYAQPNIDAYDESRALRLLAEARQLAEEIGAQGEVCPIYAALSDVHSEFFDRRGDVADLKKALTYQKLLREAEKRLFNASSDRRIQSLQVRFELEKTQQDAAVARRDAEIAHLRTVELATALAEADRLRGLYEQLASIDDLTRLYNRRYWDEQLSRAWEQAIASGGSLTIALADIDRFKQINDRFGHGAGDTTLRHVAQLLSRFCRSEDRVARYGGEEFAILLFDTPPAQAHALFEQARAAIESEDWEALIPGLRVTMSIGIASMDPPGTGAARVASADEFVAKADRNLYLAKQRGRNQVVG